MYGIIAVVCAGSLEARVTKGTDGQACAGNWSLVRVQALSAFGAFFSCFSSAILSVDAVHKNRDIGFERTGGCKDRIELLRVVRGLLLQLRRRDEDGMDMASKAPVDPNSGPDDHTNKQEVGPCHFRPRPAVIATCLGRLASCNSRLVGVRERTAVKGTAVGTGEGEARRQRDAGGMAGGESKRE
ncbi:hypothetical protein BJY59DRAFT_689105 [Rhodotorula toruloides]